MKLLSNLLKRIQLSICCPHVDENKQRTDKGKEKKNPPRPQGSAPSGWVDIPEPCVLTVTLVLL